MIAATYFMVAGGPYGLEDIVQKTGYTATLLILMITPLLWSLPTALMVSELATAIPEEGGFYIWVRRGHGPLLGISGNVADARGQCIRDGALSESLHRLHRPVHARSWSRAIAD